eukprot:CAMPEP_0172329554 /NCGR_PEP_ID=MMETSP1058-20130122/60946_1 /TAXON_ID=83371 /ORGANISM="Detonula confervacea, Strain CCMP 353" /LENGTH=353 /DNA_ID=CAMNT_0013046735 /DNA_START=284 /DNA_END=1345 /DNA_ORIENTATION=-
MQTYSQLYNSFHVVNNTKSFSTVAASTASSTDTSSNSSSSSSKDDDKSKQSNDGKSKKNEKKDDSNIFLDNLGKIFLSTIGIVLFLLLRSTISNNTRTALKDDMETIALLDPLEIDDLRVANSDFTIEVWEKVVEEIKREFPSRDAVTYPEFLSVVMRVMREAKGEGFTIQFGHLVDRIVIAELERIGKEGGDENGDSVEEQSLLQKELPLSFLFATLSLALHSSVADRVRVLYESMLSEIDTTPAEESTVSGEKVAQMIQYLQNTCQLVPVAQIVETNSKVPYQTFRVGTGDELVKRAREGYGGKKGSEGVTRESEGPVSLEEFHAILKSKTVCAWGECYVKKTGMTSTSDK